MMAWFRSAPGVFRGTGPLVAFTPRDIALLVQEANASPKRRARICAHPSDDEGVHEMLICLLNDGYIQPHCHHKCESLHVVDGRFDLVLFDDHGRILDVRCCGVGPGDTLFVRLPPGAFHTLLVRSDYVIFHETTPGPFRREDTEYAAWAPSDTDRSAADAYTRTLEAALLETHRSETPPP